MESTSRQPRGPHCPSSLQLSQLATGELIGRSDEASLRGHVRDCAACRGELEYLTTVVPPASDAAFMAALEKADPPPAVRRRAPWGLFAGLGLAAALGAVALVATRREPSGGEVRTKGVLALAVVARRASGQIDWLASGDRVAAGDGLRFELSHGAGGFAMVVGLDARPSVSIYAASARLEGPGKTLLPEAIIADATPGAERILALLCPSAPSIEEVKRAAESALAAVGGRPEAVRDLPVPCAQSAVLVRKSEGP